MIDYERLGWRPVPKSPVTSQASSPFGRSLRRDVFSLRREALNPMPFSNSSRSDASLNDARQRIRSLLSDPSPVTWVFAGDSITQGAFHTMGWRSYPELFAERVRWELRRMQDVVINTGVSGATTADLLRDVEGRILRFNPQVTSIMLGINDCTAGPITATGFRDNLNRIVEAVEVQGSLVILHTMNAVSVPGLEKAEGLPDYVSTICEIAQQHKAALIDHYSHWSEVSLERQLKNQNGGPAYWLSEGAIHPNQYGHRELAKLLFRELGIFDPASHTCRLFVP